MAMVKLLVIIAALFAQVAADPPLVDNDRVMVREMPVVSGPPGSIGRQTPTSLMISVTPSKSIAITLKDKVVAPIPNTSGFPNAFPRPNNKKVYEDNRIIVWDYTWTPGQPTPMHFHDKDVVVYYLEDGDLQSTTPNGDKTVNPYKPGMARFNLRDRTHTETLIRGKQHALITELK